MISRFCLIFLALHVCTVYSKVLSIQVFSHAQFLGATKIPTYTLIQAYTFINFTEIFPPILLFSPIRLLVFQKISHLYFYSEPSSIRNYVRILT